MNAGIHLLRRFLAMHPREAALALETKPFLEIAAILGDQQPDEAVAVWQQMALPVAGAVLGALETPSATALLCRVSHARAALMLSRQSAPTAMTLARACPEPWRTALERVRRIGALSIGALMEPAPLAVPSDWSVRQAREFLMRHPELVTFDVFVTDRDWRLLGHTDLVQLGTSAGIQAISTRMEPKPSSLDVHTTIAAAREDSRWSNVDLLPVTDTDGLLAGVLRYTKLRSFDSNRNKESLEPGNLFADAAELAWLGFASAVEITALPWNKAGNQKENT